MAASYPTFANAASMGFQFNALNEQKKVQVTDATRFPPLVARLNQVLASPAFLSRPGVHHRHPQPAGRRPAGRRRHAPDRAGRAPGRARRLQLRRVSKLHRRLNILLYLNPVWQEGWGGEIELWDKDVKNCGLRLLPAINRCLVFQTDQTSYHGVGPITAPPHVERRSFAAYYYTKEPPPGWTGTKHTTCSGPARTNGCAVMC